MQGYQFAHVETWSLAGSTGSMHHQGGTRKNGQKAWTAAQILDEAERAPGSAEHVEKWSEPPQIIPGAVASFDNLRAAHAAAAAVREPFDYTLKDGSKSTRYRKLRKDARSLYTAVFSLPVETEDARRDPMLRARCINVLETAIGHERARLEALGGTVLMGVVHWDERMVHAHLFAVDREHGRVNGLHPGTKAKEVFMHDQRSQWRLTKKQLNQGGDNAYRRAMREWQDNLHEAVFAPAGLLRVGPRRERLSRRDYMHAKRAASERQEDRERQKDLEARETDLIEFNRSMIELLDEDLAQQRAWNDAAAKRSQQLDKQDVRRPLHAIQERRPLFPGLVAPPEPCPTVVLDALDDAVDHGLDRRQRCVGVGLLFLCILRLPLAISGALLARLGRRLACLRLRLRLAAHRIVALPLDFGARPEQLATAGRVAQRVWQSLRKLRDRAAEEGREAAREKARAEFQARFDQVEAAWTATIAMRNALNAIVKQLPPRLRARLEGVDEQKAPPAANATVGARRALRDAERE